MVFGVIKKNGKSLVESHGMHQFIRQKCKKEQLTLCSIPLVRHLNERIIKRIYLYGDVIICDVWNTSHSEISYIKSHFACKLL